MNTAILEQKPDFDRTSGNLLPNSARKHDPTMLVRDLLWLTDSSHTTAFISEF
ncbi:MAG: hypothetical protein HQM08_12795 [Candidatus Riflebacteria bacterium]|nr:hypothetical protein [Candidatus Riflebacteria bacterium]